MAQTGFKPADKAVEKVLKIAQIGDSGVGKTCILNRFTENTFSATFVPTIGVDYKKKIVEVGGGRKVKVQIWDTAGQERMRKIAPMYIKGSDGVMVIFDLTERQTFESVEYWMTSIDQPGAKTEKVQKILVGNKSDSASGQRLVSTEEGLALAKKFNVPYIETSAKDNLGITEGFKSLVTSILKVMDETPAPEPERPPEPSPSPRPVLQKRPKPAGFMCCGSKS